MAQAGALDVLLRAARLRSGLSQGELAARAGVTRQAISAIEAGKAVPTTAVALKLARALGHRVDELFRLVDELPSVCAQLVGGEAQPAEAPLRVQVADIGGRLVAHPLVGTDGAVLTLPRANGLIRAAAAGKREARVDLFDDRERLSRTVVAVGCDPAMGLLADHLRRRHPTTELAWRGGSSLAALEAVARGEAHLAGTHLLDSASGQYNLPFARRLLGDDVRLVTFAVWEQGIIVAAENKRGVHQAVDLARPGVKIVNRESGSGARALLDVELTKAGLQPGAVEGYDTIVGSHLAAAEAVAAGLADAAIGVRVAARALGLGFVPLAHERYDLAIPARFVDLAPVHALLETLTSPLFRLEVEALGGYDVGPMGRFVEAV